MELLIKNTKTGESYKSKTAWGVRSIKWDDGDKRYGNREINEFLRGDGAELSDEDYKTAYAKDLKDGSVIENKPEPTHTRWQDEPATQKQYSYIRSLGYHDFKENMTKEQASKVIEMIKSGEASAINLFKSDEGPNAIF